MYFTREKLSARIPEIIAAAVRASVPISDVRSCMAPGLVDDSAMAPPPPADDPAWAPLSAGQLWGGPPNVVPGAPQPVMHWGIPENGGGTHWLRATLRVPDAWRGQPVLLALDWEGRAQSSMEAIVYLDGQTLSGLDEFHRTILLPEPTHSGEHELLLRCYTPFYRPFGGLSLRLRDTTIFRLGQAMQAALGAVETYRDSDSAKHALLSAINSAYNALDLSAGYQSQKFADSARAALDLLLPAAGSAEPAPANDAAPWRNALEQQPPTVIGTGHAHLDVAWLWPLWRTRQKVAHTVANALHLMERYPDYHFSMSQPQVYSYLKHDDPALYARMKEMIAAGRFEPVGMMWLEPDCNVTSGESLVRQLIEGQRFFSEEFGVRKHIVWLPDVFGYSAAMPQLLRGVGIDCFMTTKISWNQFNRAPNDTFRWRGIDGSEVLTHFITATDQPLKHPSEAQFYTYVGRMSGQEVYGLWNHYRQKDINNEVLYSYGWGDGGGGPTEEMLEAAALFADLPGFPRVQLGRVDEYFERLYQHVWQNPNLPTWAGELYLEYHRGTYTGQARAKQQNRQAEQLYRETEWLNAWAVLHGAANQQDQLNAGWRVILLNQFHDILPGSSIAQVYIDSNAQYAQVRELAGTVGSAALAAIVPDAAGGAGAQVIFNSLGWDRHEPARIALPEGSGAPALLSASGTPLEQQEIEDSLGRALLCELNVPSFGYASLAPASGAQPAPAPSTPASLHASKNRLENAILRIELDENGEICSLYDKTAGREVLVPGSTGNQLVAYEDRPMAWSAWDIDIFYEEKPSPVREIIDWRVVEEGPLRCAVQITRRLGQSTITQRICLWRNSRRIDFITDVDWKERLVLLRAQFPLDINTDHATCEIQFGAVERPTHRNTTWDIARFEVCAHRWVDLGEDGYGVALLNDCKYGHSLHNNTLGISLLKSADHPDRNADLGQHRFTYSLYPHLGSWRDAQVVRRAYELNVPLRAVERAGLPADVPASASLLSTSTEHIVVETVKVADDGDGLIVRLYEAHNRRGMASLRFGQPVASAVETDLLEHERGAIEVIDSQIHVDIRPYEIKTIRVRF